MMVLVLIVTVTAIEEFSTARRLKMERIKEIFINEKPGTLSNHCIIFLEQIQRSQHVITYKYTVFCDQFTIFNQWIHIFTVIKYISSFKWFDRAGQM